MTMLNGALKFAEVGIKVFPLDPNSKRPPTRCARYLGVSRGQDEATTDRQTIIRWWTRVPAANVGIACEPSGLYVVDIDCHNGAQGFESWKALTDIHGEPATFTVRTPSGGKHLYFWMPEPSLKNTAGKLGKGIDTRGNGYVVAPPSIVSDIRYQIEDVRAVTELPSWIVEALTVKKPAPSKNALHIAIPSSLAEAIHTPTAPADLLSSPQSSHAPADEVIARVGVLADELAGAPDGEGNNTAARVAFMVGGYVGAGQIDENHAVTLLTDSIASWTYRNATDEQTMMTTIRRQITEGTKSPRAWEASTSSTQEEGTPAPPLADPSDDPEQHAVRSDWSTDDGQARFLHKSIGGILYVIGLGWHLWDGQRWRSVNERRVSFVIKKFYKNRFDYYTRRSVEAAGDTELCEKWSGLAEAYSKFMNTRKLVGIVSALERIDPVEPDQLDAHPELLNTPRGIVNLRTGEIGKHDPVLLLTKITKGSYRPGYRHPDWDAALAALPAEVISYFQLRLGQAATGRIPESDDCLILQGNGANGKSLMTSDGVMRALGDFAMLASPGLILAKDTSGGASPERASVRGARFVLIEELPEGRSLSIEELKRIVGTSQITARMLYKDEMTFTTSHTLFVTTNYLPTVNETDDGAWRRLCLVNFPYKFSTDPQGPDEKMGDPMMKQRVREGVTGQHDAIVTWIVEGSRRYLADPTAIMEPARPARIQGDTRQWRGQADRIMSYLDARIIFDSDGAIARSDLYTDFTDYLSECGHAKWSQETFFSRLVNHELYRRGGLSEGQVRSAAGLSRPSMGGVAWSSALPSLPSRPRVVRGVRFRVDSDDELA
jgi:P4 family phage/plasmid primase-like protien